MTLEQRLEGVDQVVHVNPWGRSYTKRTHSTKFWSMPSVNSRGLERLEQTEGGREPQEGKAGREREATEHISS